MFRAIEANVARRVLVNFHADPAVVQRELPPPFEPLLQEGKAIIGVCLLRLENARTPPIPFGIDAENAAYRYAVQWREAGELRTGVFIPRRDTASTLTRIASGRLFPTLHEPAKIEVAERPGAIAFRLRARGGNAEIRLRDAPALPSSSCFSSVRAASTFFERGALGVSPTKRGFYAVHFDVESWNMAPLAVETADVEYFGRFPAGTLEIDSALIMRNLRVRLVAQAFPASRPAGGTTARAA